MTKRTQQLVFARGSGRQHALVRYERGWWTQGRRVPVLACKFPNGVLAPNRRIFRGVVTCQRCLRALRKRRPA